LFIFRMKRQCDVNFVPQLSGRVDLNEYGAKIFNNAIRFEAWSGDILIGLIAVYCNDLQHRRAYVTTVSVLTDSMGKGVASRLMSECIAYVTALDFQCLELEVNQHNRDAISLYEKKGFVTDQVDGSSITMRLEIKGVISE